MGDSDKLSPSGPDRYRIPEHAEYLDALFDTLGLDQNVTLVINDWGSALGFDWARRHPDSDQGHRLHGSHRDVLTPIEILFNRTSSYFAFA